MHHSLIFFINLEDDIKSLLVTFSGHPRIAGVVNKAEGGLQLDSDVHCRVKWSQSNKMHLNTTTYRLIHLGTKDAYYIYRMGDSVLESSDSERDARGHIVDNHHNVSSQCNAVAKMSNVPLDV